MQATTPEASVHERGGGKPVAKPRQTDRDDDNPDVPGTKLQSLERVGDRDVRVR